MSSVDKSWILVGKFRGIFGVHGALRLQSFTEPLEQIAAYQPWYVGKDKHPVDIATVRPYRKGLLVQLPGCDTPEMARGWVEQSVFVPRTVLPSLPVGQYYWSDLYGMRVMSAPPEARDCGKVVRIENHGAHSVLFVQADGAAAHTTAALAIPFVIGPVIDRVLPEQGEIWLTPGFEW